jgi:hypothetical protein
MNKVFPFTRSGKNPAENHLAAFKGMTRLARFRETYFSGGAERVHRHAPALTLGAVSCPAAAPMAHLSF